MDLVQKLQMCAGYSENRAQAAKANLDRIANNEPPLNATKAENLADAISGGFLPPITKERLEYIEPIPRKWAPEKKIESVLGGLKAFEPLKWEW